MRKILNKYKKNNRALVIWESPNKLRGEVYENGNKTMFADFLVKDNEATEHRILEYFGMVGAYKEVKYTINKQRRVIWTNNDYDEWEKAMRDDGFDEEEINYDRYADHCSIFIDDERANLDVEVDGYIVAFADSGFWNGRRNGGGVIGTCVKDILYSECAYVTWYCDVHNVRCEAIHHDGTNHYLYRVAKDKETAERLAYKIAYEDMSEEQFRKATKSLRPYVAKVYGW